MLGLGKTKVERYANPAIWTDFNSFIRRNRRRFLVRQKPVVIWFTGLSGSGKTTLAESVEKAILNKGYFTKYFDDDIIRLGLCKDLSQSPKDIIENIRRTAETAKMFNDSGLIVLCSFVSHTDEMRQLAKTIIGHKRFIEVYVNCPLEICELRDTKGMYKKYRLGLNNNVPGLDLTYIAPKNPDIEVRTDLWDVNKCTRYIMRNVLKVIKFRKK